MTIFFNRNSDVDELQHNVFRSYLTCISSNYLTARPATLTYGILPHTAVPMQPPAS